MPDFSGKSIVSGTCRLCLCYLAAIAVVLPSVGCRGQKSSVGPSSFETSAADGQHVAGIRLEMLRKAGLRLNWPLQLPMGRAQTIKKIFYHNGQLYVINDHNRLYALDADNGIIIWSCDLALPRFSCSAVKYYQDSLLFVLGNTFVQVRETDGKILKRMELDFPVSTSIARNADQLFVGSTNNRFYALRFSDGIPLWQSLCPDEPLGVVAIYQDKIFFAARDNVLYVSKTDQRQLVWKAQTAGLLAGVLVDNQQCFLPSADTALYCFEPDTGTELWKYLAGGSLAEMPTLTRTAIYQPIQHSALVCLERYPDSPNGKVRWELPDGYCLLAENGSVSYVMTLNKELTLMNNITGKRIMSFYVPRMNLYARNGETALIFLASREGTIVALKPEKTEPPLEPPPSAPPSDIAPLEYSEEIEGDY